LRTEWEKKAVGKKENTTVFGIALHECQLVKGANLKGLTF